MALRSRPLLVDGIDADRYVARPALEGALADAVMAERNTLLLGRPGTGKTTLLRKLAADLRPTGKPVAWVNPAIAGDGIQLLELIADALAAAANVTDDATPRTAPADATGPLRLLRALDLVPREPPAVVILDGPVDDQAGYDVFGRLRDQLWELPHTWVLAATPERSGPVRAAPADAFWSTIVEVGPFDAREIEQMLARGLTPAERLLVDAHERRPLQDTPRGVVRFVQDVLDGTASGDDVPADVRHERAVAIGPSASMALAELEALGHPAAAGDPELLERLGWTRPYTSRILASLEAHGLLRSFPGPTTGQGRPPKLYEPNPKV